MRPGLSNLVRASDALLALLTLGNLGWTTFCLGGYRPETMAVSAPLLLVTLAAAWACRAWRPSRREEPWWVLAGPLPFLVYAAVNTALVSPVPWLGLFDWSLWLHFAAAYWLGVELLRRPEPRAMLWIGVALIGVGAVVLAIYQRTVDPGWLPLGRRQAVQYLSRSGGPFGIPNSLAAALLLLIGAAGAVAFDRQRRSAWRLAAAVLGLVYVLGLALTISRGAWLSLIAAVALAPWLAAGRTWRWRLGLSAALAGLAIVSGALAYQAVPSVRARLDAFRADRGERTRPIMWQMSWRLFRESPWVGSGAGSYRVLLERHRPEEFKDSPKWAHNDYLNTLSDHGAAGFVLAFGALGAALILVRRGVRGAERQGRAAPRNGGLTVGLIAFGLSVLVDFHLKIPALAHLLGLVLAAWVVERVATAAPATDAARARRIARALAAAGLVVLAAAAVRPRWSAEALRYEARQTIDALAGVSDPDRLRAGIEPAVAALRAAAERDPRNAQAWSDLSFALSQRGHYATAPAAELGRAAEVAAREAVRQGDVVPEFWVHLGIALDLQGRWVEAGRCFARAVKLAPNHQMMWYYQAHHYSLNPAARPLARAAIATCLRLDPANPAAEALREQLRDR